MIAPPPPTGPTLRSVKPQVDLAPVPLVHSAHFLRPMDATLNFSLSQTRFSARAATLHFNERLARAR